MKDMIYYPGFETRNQNWLKFALLYFDRLRPIIPYIGRPEREYLSEPFRRVMDSTDLVEPYRPNDEEGYCASILACEECEKYLRTPERYGHYFQKSRSPGFLSEWRDGSRQNCTLFRGKYSNVFYDFCLENGLAVPCREGIRISSDLAFVYMSFLADIIAKKNEYEMITDVQKYSKFLLSRNLSASRAEHIKAKAVENKVDLPIPSDLSGVPLQEIIALRNSRDFSKARRAYINEVEQLLIHRETDQDYSLKKLLSCRQEFVGIGERVLTLTASAALSAYGIYALTEAAQGEEVWQTVAAAVLNAHTARDACRDIPGYVRELKTKRLARRYVAKLEQLDKPAVNR